jgi:hypothetical protein
MTIPARKLDLDNSNPYAHGAGVWTFNGLHLIKLLPPILYQHHHLNFIVANSCRVLLPHFTIFFTLILSSGVWSIKSQQAFFILSSLQVATPHARDIFHLNLRDTEYGRTKNGPKSANNEQQEKSNLDSDHSERVRAGEVALFQRTSK